MNQLLTCDFETYYDREYSLSKMSTEDYICDPRFEVILVSVKVNDAKPQWFSGTLKQTKEWLHQFPFRTSGVIGHNQMFDATILQHVFDLRPGVIFDTISMAQAQIRPFTSGVSLAKCLEYCDFEGLRKGTAVHNMIGRTRASLSRSELYAYADYCMTDVEGTYLLFQHLKPIFPRSEFQIMDMTHRMYLDPVIELDAPLLAQILAEEKANKAALMQRVQSICTTDQLMSNDKFAEVLTKLGVELPMKVSPTTGGLTYAFAKSDPEFKAMCEEYEDNELVSLVIDARLGVKSTIKETRTERLLKIATTYGKLRVPLNYYAAHTGRYGGTQKINMQNPPRINKKQIDPATKKTSRRQIRYAMKAPKGHVFIAADLSQIEARIVAWLAKCNTLVTDFANKADVYSRFATIAYGIETVKDRSPDDDLRRFVGKTCILGLGYGMGHKKLRTTLAKDNVKLDEKESQKLVYTYRGTYHEIPTLWSDMDYAMRSMMRGDRGKIGPLMFGKEMVVLPNGMPMHYRDLRHVAGGDVMYTFGVENRKLFGGKLTENIVQALARIIVMDNMIAISKAYGLQPVLQVHDELDYIVPEADAARLVAGIKQIMSVPPSWAPDLPVAAEVNTGYTFGDCK